MSRKSAPNDVIVTGPGRPFTIATKIGASIGIFLAMITVLLPGYFAYVGRLCLLPPGHSEAELVTYGSRLLFTVKYWVLPLGWLVVNCHLVAISRVMTLAVNPLSDNEHVIHAIKNVFTNSVEQFLMSAVAQMVLIAHVTELQVYTLIPLINLLHLIGRICFWLLYPRLRSFGFILTFLPTNISLGYGIYMLFANHVSDFVTIK